MRFVLSAVGCVILLPLAMAQTPSVTEDGVLNAAGYVKAGNPGFAVAPGSLVAIFGADLADGLVVADSVPLSTSLANVSVTFNDMPAPILFVSPGQVNAQLPSDILPEGASEGVAGVVVRRGANSSQPRNVQVARFSPAIFTLPGTGLGPAVAVNNDDGSLAQPEGSVPGVPAEPARRGRAVIIYANGLGGVDPPVEDGRASLDALRYATTMPAVLVGGIEAQVVFAGLSPQFPAVNQINIVVPANAPIGNAVPLQIRLGGLTTSDQVTIAIRE
jgi:trimeric autotransporter adhesin